MSTSPLGSSALISVLALSSACGGSSSSTAAGAGGDTAGSSSTSATPLVAGAGGASQVPATGGGIASVATGGSSDIVTSGGVSAGGVPNETGGARSGTTGGSPSSGGASSSSHTGGSNTGGTTGARASGGTMAGGARCSARGGAGNAGGFGDALPPISMKCTSDAQCAGKKCYDGPAAQTRSCRTPCDTAAVGQQGNCAAGQICTYAMGAASAACLDPCTPFQEPTTCRDGDWCYPAPNGSFTKGVSVPGLCLAAGDYPEGTRCPGGGCGVGLLCVSPALNALDTYNCERACLPGATPDQAGACSTQESCLTSLDGHSYCALACNPFGNTSQCPVGEWCYPFHDYITIYLGVQGRCIKTGKHPAGASCTLGDCGEGLKCVSEPEPRLSGAAATCRPICDPHASQPCANGDTCVPDRMSGTALDVGTCQKSCALWQGDACSAGCASDEWCAPTYLDQGFGRCVRAAGELPGATCTTSKVCSAGNMCLFGASSSFGRCERLCELSSAGIDPVNCQPNEVCAPQPIQGGFSTFGVCRGSCDYDAGIACTEPAKTCVPGELVPHGKDTCLDIPTSGGCSLTAPIGTACGPTALCLGDAIVASCTNVCRISKGAIGTSNHPDCPKPASICTEISTGLAYGKCK